MSLSSARSSVARIQKELADLRAKDANEAKKEADLVSKINRASADARTTKVLSTATSKLNEVSRYSNDLASVQKRRADVSRSIAGKTSDLNRYLGEQEREEAKERKRIADEDRKLEERQKKQLRDLDAQIAVSLAAARSVPVSSNESIEYDVFISHASEDKESFADDLAARLKDAGLQVWYDDMVLKWGDSLRRSIDKGLANSRFGVVVLSDHFFRKEWPQRELDGLVQLETAGRSRILPIWHKISKDEVARASPTLADKVALNTAIMSMDEIVAELKKLAD